MTRPFITNSFTNSTFSSNSAVVMSSLRTSRLQFFSAAGWVKERGISRRERRRRKRGRKWWEWILREMNQQEGEEEGEGEELVEVDIKRSGSEGGGGRVGREGGGVEGVGGREGRRGWVITKKSCSSIKKYF